MVNKTFETICDVTFIDEIGCQKVTLRLGPPILDQREGWYCCSTEISGVDGEGFRQVRGGNPFQALCLSLERFRIAFQNKIGDFRDLNGDSPHMLFPRQVPWDYGSDVYYRLCKMIDDEVQNIEDERTRRREADEKKRGA